jgi:hypothetical protein
MDHLISVESAALASGEPVSRLRTWCATGRLLCEKENGQWLIALSQIPRIVEIVAQHDRAVADGHAVAVLVPVDAATPDLAAEIARRLGLKQGRTVSTSTLALDGSEYLIAVWKTDGAAPIELAPVAALVKELGGELLDGEIAENPGLTAAEADGVTPAGKDA